MSENKPLIIRKRNRKTPEVRAFIRAKELRQEKQRRQEKESKQFEEEREYALREIENDLMERYTYGEVLRMQAEYIYDLEVYGDRTWFELETLREKLREAESEVYRLMLGEPDFVGGDDDGRNSLVSAIHQLASVTAEKGRIVGVKHKAKKGGVGKHNKHTKPKKEEVREWWLKWQADPSLFKNKTTFDERMSDKTGMKQRTIENWRKELQEEHTVS